MKIYNKKSALENNTIKNALLDYKNQRKFNVHSYIEKKIQYIDDYFDEYQIKTAVIGISGGIDSAVALGILKKTRVKNICAVFIPAYESSGVTGQRSAYERAKKLCNHWNIELKELDISLVGKILSQDIQKSVEIKGDNWSEGQLIPYLRTTALYFYTTLFTQIGEKALIIGTTNADEGQYIGYFGKASDGLVDLQIISDIHKSEVYQLGKNLEVEYNVMTISPRGDMFDGRIDEEVFGFTYEFLEFYRYYYHMSEKEKRAFKEKLENDLYLFELSCENVEKMHQYNKHKYLGCSPAVHLDVLDTKFKNGWYYNNWKKP